MRFHLAIRRPVFRYMMHWIAGSTPQLEGQQGTNHPKLPMAQPLSDLAHQETQAILVENTRLQGAVHSNYLWLKQVACQAALLGRCLAGG